MKYEEKIAIVPVWEKCTLTVEEATAYTGIGKHKLCASFQTIQIVNLFFGLAANGFSREKSWTSSLKKAKAYRKEGDYG